MCQGAYLKYKNSLKICFWNIHGAKSKIVSDKLADSEFLKNLKNSDIVALAELHNEEEVALPGYILIKQKNRKKVHRGPKVSGGIAIFVKNYLHKLIHIIPNTNENSIWIKIRQKSNKNKNDDIFIGTYYLSPRNKSNKNNIDIFEIDSK